MLPIGLLLSGACGAMQAMTEVIETVRFNKKQFRVLEEKASLLLKAIQDSIHNSIDTTTNDVLGTQLQDLTSLFLEINKWIAKQTAKSNLVQVAQFRQIQTKIQIWHTKLDTHCQALNISLHSWDAKQIMQAQQEDMNVILHDIFSIIQQNTDTLDQISSKLGIAPNEIVDGLARLESLTVKYKDQMKGIEGRLAALMDNLRLKSGRHFKSSIPEWLSVSIDDITFLGDRPFGFGSYGEVWRAEYNDREVAVKRSLEVVHGQVAADMIQEELTILYKLCHPNVIPIYGGSVKTERPFMITPYYGHGNVFSFLQVHASQVSLKHRIKLILDIAKGMRYLHSKNIIHGDLKGDNVLVDDNFAAIISDFGLSRMREQMSSSRSSKKKKTFAVRWIAPERYKFKEKKDPFKMDVFAFAMTAYQILVGKLPFWEEKEDEVVKEYIKEGERPSRISDIPSELWRLLEQCWHHDVEQRPSFDQICSTVLVTYERVKGPLLNKLSLLIHEQKDDADSESKSNSEIITSSLPTLNAIPVDIQIHSDKSASSISSTLEESDATLVRSSRDSLQYILPSSATIYQIDDEKEYGYASLKRYGPKHPDASQIGSSSEGTDLEPTVADCSEKTNRKHPGVSHLEDFSFSERTHLELLRAAQVGDSSLVSSLIQSGADVNSRRSDGFTALSLAAFEGHFDLVKLLIENGAQIDCPQKDGITALFAAARNGHLEIVQFLLDKNANPHVRSNRGLTMLIAASGKGHTDVVKLLLAKGADPNVQARDGCTALMISAQNGHADVVKMLLASGARVNTHDHDGDTALLYAVVSGHVDVIRILLAHGADVNMQTPRGDSALLFSSEYGHSEVTRVLLQESRYVHINIQNANGETCLMLATRNADLKTVELLLSYGADIDKRDRNGDSALTIAKSYGHQEIVIRLTDTASHYLQGIVSA